MGEPGLTIVPGEGGIGPLIEAGFYAAARGRQAHLFCIEEPGNAGGSYAGISSTSYSTMAEGKAAIREILEESRPGDAVLLDMTSFEASPIELEDLGALAFHRGVVLVVALTGTP